MKNLFRLAIGVFVLLLFTGVNFARSKKDFDEVLKSLNIVVDNYTSEKYYEKYEFTNKKTGEKKKFADFEEANRAVFMFLRGELFSRELEELQEQWKEELKLAEETTSNADEANRKNIEEYINKLINLRKKNAQKLEIFIDNIFKKWPDKFTKEEQTFTIRSIKDYNDKHKLIKRE
jgi:hypothetical protein